MQEMSRICLGDLLDFPRHLFRDVPDFFLEIPRNVRLLSPGSIFNCFCWLLVSNTVHPEQRPTPAGESIQLPRVQGEDTQLGLRFS